MSNKRRTYPLGDTPTSAETRGADFNDRYAGSTIHEGSRSFKAVMIGRPRPPKKGEWYLSGAAPMAYRAPNDLTSSYHIMKLVRVRTTTTAVETVEEI